jgi:hypothetical protein
VCGSSRSSSGEILIRHLCGVLVSIVVAAVIELCLEGEVVADHYYAGPGCATACSSWCSAWVKEVINEGEGGTTTGVGHEMEIRGRKRVGFAVRCEWVLVGRVNKWKVEDG